MDCRSANDVYLLLKSSDFVVHDLEQVFEGVVDDDEEEEDEGESEEDEEDEEEEGQETRDEATDPSALHHNHHRTQHQQAHAPIPYHLILRKSIPALNPALEFRCFVRARSLLCLCQRDLNHYPFLPALVPHLRTLIQDFFTKNLQDSFPDPNFAFDVYVPGPRHERCWLIDVNPWAERTDPLLFSWREILERPWGGVRRDEGEDGGGNGAEAEAEEGNGDGEEEEDEEEAIPIPEFRLVNRDDPEAYAFNTPQYSAHKLPKEVVEAGGVGEGGIREFLGRWRELERRHGSGHDEVDEEDEADADTV